MLVLVDVKPAIGADVILVKPRLDALNVEVVVAGKVEDLAALFISSQTDGTHVVWIILRYCFYWYFLENVCFDSILFFDLFFHVLILKDHSRISYIKSLKSSYVHTCYWTVLVVCSVIIHMVHHWFPFIVPVYEIQIVLTCWVYLYWFIILHTFKNHTLLCNQSSLRDLVSH